jgi:hypothetical protein
MRQNHKSQFDCARGDSLSSPFAHAGKLAHDWPFCGLSPQDTYLHTSPTFGIQPGERFSTLAAAYFSPLPISLAAFVDTHEVDDAALFEARIGMGEDCWRELLQAHR